MLGLMMQTPLLLSSILMHAARSFPDVEIVSRTPDRPDHITNYSGLLERSSRLANALDSIGIKPGDRVATLAWNSYRHLELYFGISGMGAVCHTINPRLFADQITYIINHAEDAIVFFDLAFIDLVHSLMPQCPTVEAWIYLGEAGDAKLVGAKGFHPMKDFSPGARKPMHGRSSTRTRHADCATRRERQETQRVCCIAIAAPCCIPAPQRSQTLVAFLWMTRSRLSRRCSTQCLGECRIVQRRGVRSW